jgi:phage terminase small subunit
MQFTVFHQRNIWGIIILRHYTAGSGFLTQTPTKNSIPKRTLDARESRFVDEYLIDLNTERAALAAGYSPSMAKSKAYQWVSNGKVKNHVFMEVQRRKTKLTTALGITSQLVVKEIAKVGFASMRQFLHIDVRGQPQINLTDTPDDDLDALSEVSTETVMERDGVDKGGNPIFAQIRKTKVKLHDKLAALEKLARFTGVYDKETEKAAGAFADAISDIQQRMSRAPIRRDVSQDGDK